MCPAPAIRRVGPAGQGDETALVELGEDFSHHRGEGLGPVELQFDEVDRAHGDVVPQRRQAQGCVGEDVPHSQFDEPAEGSQGFQSGPDRRAGQ
jgi:hypothetical protein